MITLGIVTVDEEYKHVILNQKKTIAFLQNRVAELTEVRLFELSGLFGLSGLSGLFRAIRVIQVRPVH